MSQSGDSRPRVLVVDDDPDQLQLVCDTLAMHYKRDPADGIVGVTTTAECLAQELHRYDVILLDYYLPDGTGLDALQDILARVDVPVIFVTGENDSTTAAEAIRRGAQDYIVKMGDYLFAIPTVVEKALSQHRIRLENERLRQRLQEMLRELQAKNVELVRSLEKVEVMAATDHLTGLANRRRFSVLLNRYYHDAVRYGFDITCCMCDLDSYKRLNDSLGHQVGDEILVLTADIIRETIRGTDVAARYGGDEFVLLFPHTSLSEATAVLERVRHRLREASRRHEKVGQALTLSMGAASLETDHPDSADALVSLADRALYIAKDQGKDRIVAFHSVAAAALAK